jgi:tRNA(fMet)-specific endonuclease VapC
MDSTSLCIDTNLLIEYLKGRDPGASAVEKAVKEVGCAVTAITVYELLFGKARGQKAIGEEALLTMLTVLSLDKASAKRAAVLHDTLIRQNQDIGLRDVLIAAICLEHQIPLLTLNEKHFSRVPGLQMIPVPQFLGNIRE